ncbi:acyl-CoA dehydrogenase family protein [Actinomycetospora sp. CA-084318]|uniref:acyl-CoA dehydrogenase family protein n=1 Tax=Actinomycetospora sp. CA-084318 TaxID=3239892 RepID=UPI003D985EB8
MTVYAEEHEELRSAVRALLEKSADSATVRATLGTGRYDDALWRRMSDELGLPGLAVAESRGGSGFGILELAVVLEEIGRANLPSPFLTTVLAALALEAAGGPVADDLVPDLAAGTRTAAVHLPGGHGPAGWDLRDATVTGTLLHVPEAHAADLLVLVAADRGAVVDLTAVGVTVTALETMDLTRGQARVELTGARARTLDVDPGWSDAVTALAAVLVACEQVGGAERMLEVSTAHAGDRVQFGRPVGSFQAVKHLLADMLVEVELARTVQQHAVALAAAGTAPATDLDAAAHVAHLTCSEAFRTVTGDAIRVHGGIGYTWEHDAHLYFRRARASAVLFADVAAHADRLATTAGLVADPAQEAS